MVRVADHLSVAELERRFRACPDPVEARHVQAIWLLAQGCTVGATTESPASAPAGSSKCWSATTDPGPRPWPTGRNGLKPSLLTPEVPELVRVRLAEPPDGRLWSSRKVADVIAAHLGLKRVLPHRGWGALNALGYTLQRPRPKSPKPATAEEVEAFQEGWRMPSPRKRPPTPESLSGCSAPTSTASA